MGNLFTIVLKHVLACLTAVERTQLKHVQVHVVFCNTNGLLRSDTCKKNKDINEPEFKIKNQRKKSMFYFDLFEILYSGSVANSFAAGLLIVLL